MLKALDILTHLFFPIVFLFQSAIYIPVTIFRLIISGQISTLFSISAFKDAWFANFWFAYGPSVREGAIPHVQPLLALSRGVVLEIGPGSGEWVHLFPRDKVSKIYGVEPNKDHHESLRKKIKAAGLTDIYVIVPIGVEDLGGEWVQKGDVDTVVTVQCLCSVGKPREMIKLLEEYLRPGGQWIVYEHVVTHTGGFIAFYQSLIDLVWPHFLGGCSITRDTGKWLKEAAVWSVIDLKQPEEEPSYRIVPHIMGTLTK